MERDRYDTMFAYGFCSSFVVMLLDHFNMVPEGWFGFTAFVFSCIGAMYGLYETRDRNINAQEIPEIEMHEAVEIEKEINAPVYEEYQFFFNKQKQQKRRWYEKAKESI